MENLKKKAGSAGLSVFAAVFLFFAIQSLFSGVLQSQRIKIQQTQIEKDRKAEFLNQKPAYEALWNEKKIFFEGPATSEEILNAWMKNLLAYATSENLVFRKLEPGGTKEDKGVKEIRLFLSFAGDMPKLIRFYYFLHDKDPLSRIHTFALQKDEESKQWIFEFELAKVILG